MNEIASAEEQLGLLRLIIDNTWTAIKQQANSQASQQISQPRKIKPKTIPKVKPAPMAAPPKPLPKPKPIQPISVKPQPQQELLAKQLHHQIAKLNKNISTQVPNGSTAPISEPREKFISGT
jgi:hypothetical protein